jgi:transposase
VEVAPWRLALVMVMQYVEGLTDSQAADAVSRCMDWNYALSLNLADPDFLRRVAAGLAAALLEAAAHKPLDLHPKSAI